MDFSYILGGRTKENLIENRRKNIKFFYIEFYVFFVWFWLHFRVQKFIENRDFWKKCDSKVSSEALLL